MFPSDLRQMIDECLVNKEFTWHDMSTRVGCVVGGRLLAHSQRDPEDFNPAFPDLMEGLDSVGLGFCGHTSFVSFIRVIQRRVRALSWSYVTEVAEISRSTLWRVTKAQRFTVRVLMDICFACGLDVAITYQPPKLRLIGSSGEISTVHNRCRPTGNSI